MADKAQDPPGRRPARRTSSRWRPSSARSIRALVRARSGEEALKALLTDEFAVDPARRP